ncbi:MAG: hypothetical protein FK732_09670 [Asgard group archaeon]|jgi:hypothetical protein|nr:hypothetical protein [Asgard group archaeon]
MHQKANNIKHIRLINNDEIIGNLVDTKNGVVTIDKPLVVENFVDDDQREKLVLMNYVSFSKQEHVELLAGHIITMCNVHDEIEKYYYNSLKAINLREQAMIDTIKDTNEAVSDYEAEDYGVFSNTTFH